MRTMVMVTGCYAVPRDESLAFSSLPLAHIPAPARQLNSVRNTNLRLCLRPSPRAGIGKASWRRCYFQWLELSGDYERVRMCMAEIKLSEGWLRQD